MVDVTALNYLPVPQGEFATWEDDLVRLENGWWPTGGAVDPGNDGGIMNWQALVLGERTEYLKHALGGIGDVAFDIASLNALAKTGMYNYANGVTGNPLAGAGGRVSHFEGAADAAQLAVTSTGRMFWRIRTAAAWANWSEAVSFQNGGDIFGDLSVSGLFSLDGTGEINGPVDINGAAAFFRFLSASTAQDPAWKWYLDDVLTWSLMHTTNGDLNFVLDAGAPDQDAWVKINGQKIWTEAENGVGESIQGNGYQQFPSGLLMQWARGNANHNTAMTFPIAFPNQVYGITFGERNLDGVPEKAHIVGYDENTLTLSGFTFTSFRHDGVAESSGYTYIALGH
jgi:hypothetical protein